MPADLRSAGLLAVVTIAAITLAGLAGFLTYL